MPARRPKPLKPLPVLYLSGPMTGYDDFNFPAFNEMARKLRNLGFPVLNPADFGGSPSSTWHDCLRRDLGVLCHADVLILLDGWDRSKGAGLELDVALGMDKRIIQVTGAYGVDGMDLPRFVREHFEEHDLNLALLDDQTRQALHLEFARLAPPKPAPVPEVGPTPITLDADEPEDDEIDEDLDEEGEEDDDEDDDDDDTISLDDDDEDDNEDDDDVPVGGLVDEPTPSLFTEIFGPEIGPRLEAKLTAFNQAHSEAEVASLIGRRNISPLGTLFAELERAAGTCTCPNCMARRAGQSVAPTFLRLPPSLAAIFGQPLGIRRRDPVE